MEYGEQVLRSHMKSKTTLKKHGNNQCIFPVT